MAAAARGIDLLGRGFFRLSLGSPESNVEVQKFVGPLLFWESLQ